MTTAVHLPIEDHISIGVQRRVCPSSITEIGTLHVHVHVQLAGHTALAGPAPPTSMHAGGRAPAVAPDAEVEAAQLVTGH